MSALPDIIKRLALVGLRQVLDDVHSTTDAVRAYEDLQVRGNAADLGAMLRLLESPEGRAIPWASDLRYVVAENLASVRARELAKEFAEASKPIGHWGDGNGGALLELIVGALSDAGIYSPEEAAESLGDSRKSIPAELRTRVYERDAYRCVACGSHKDLTLDHIHPWSLGGEDTFENLQTMCRPCNSSKGARLPKKEA